MAQDAPPTPDDVALRDYADGDESAIAEILAECHAGVWNDAAYWRWKHGRRPGFDPADVLCAESGSRVIGCFHTGVLPLRIEPLRELETLRHDAASVTEALDKVRYQSRR